VLHLIQTKPHYKLMGQDKLKIELEQGGITQRVLAIKKIFSELKSK